MELFDLIFNNIKNNKDYNPEDFIGFSYLPADGYETRSDKICIFYKNVNGAVNVLYTKIDPTSKKLVKYDDDDEDDIKLPEMNKPMYQLDYNQLQYFKDNLHFYIGEDEHYNNPEELNNFCEMINNREKQREWINKKLGDKKLSIPEQNRSMIDFLKFNYLLIRENDGKLINSELKHLVNTELDTKLFSASHKRSDKHYSEIVVEEPSPNSKLKSAISAGYTFPKNSKGSENKILLSINRIEKSNNTVLEKVKTIDNDTLRHELGHFKLHMIFDEVRERIERIIDSFDPMTEGQRSMIISNMSYVIYNKIKKYIQDKSLKRYNEAAQLVGLKIAEKGKTYNKYEDANEVSEKLLMGHSSYSRYNSAEYLAEVESTDNYENAILNELFDECFNNDFSKINRENVDRFLKKVGIDNINKEYFAAKQRLTQLYNYIDCEAVIIGVSFSTNLAEKVNIGNEFIVKLLFDNSDNVEGIEKIAKYTIILRALENVTDEMNPLKDSEQQYKEKFKENLEKEFNNFYFEKIKNKFPDVDINNIRSKVLKSINKYKNEIENLKDLRAGLTFYKTYCIGKKQPVSFKMVDQIFNYDERNYHNNAIYKKQNFVLMNKFKSAKPYFNNLVKRLRKKSESNENIKTILKEELHDIYDAYLFYSFLGKNLDKFVNPFNMEIKTEKNFVDETENELNRMIDTIDLDSSDLKKISMIENKSFFNLFAEYKKINKNQNIKQNTNQNVNALTSKRTSKKVKLGIIDSDELNSKKSSKHEDLKEENINTVNKYNRKDIAVLNNSNKQEDKKDENIITIKKKKIDKSSNKNMESKKQLHSGESKDQKPLNLDTLKTTVKNNHNNKRINEHVANNITNENNNNLDNSNNQINSNNQVNFTNHEVLNLIRIYKILDIALEKINLPPNANPQILIPTGPMYLIGGKKEVIGFPNIIMRVGKNDAYYLSNKGIISPDTVWRPLNNNFDKLLETKVSINDERRSERIKDHGKLESRDGVGIINLNGKDEIEKFKTDLETMIKNSKENLHQFVTKNEDDDSIKAYTHICEKENEFNNSEPIKILTALHKDIDYKFDQKKYTSKANIPFVRLERINNFIKYNRTLNINNEQEESKSKIKINEITNNNKHKNKNIARNNNMFKPLGRREESESVGCCCIK